MNHKKKLPRTFKPNIEALEDRWVPSTQVMGSFALGVGDAHFWDGPVVHGTIIAPDTEGGDGANHAGTSPVDPPLCGQDGFPCWDYKFNLAAGGGRFRFALDEYVLGVRTCPDCAVLPNALTVLAAGNSYGVAVIDPDGNYQQVNYDGAVFRNGYSDERFVEAPTAGVWTVRVIPFALTDVGFRMRAKLEAASPLSAEPTPLYPNLRIIPAFEFTFMTPTVTFGPGVDIPGLNTGCMAEEIADPETGDSPLGRACLRFSMGIENAGEGPLAIQGLAADGTRTDATATNPVVAASQRIYVSCGVDCHTWQDLPAGSAGELEYHATHQHSHYQQAWMFQLFKVMDAKTGLIDRVGEGHKTGFGPGDEMLTDWKRFYQCNRLGASVAANGPATEPCRYTFGADAEKMLGTGWGDVYEWNRSGNYVDLPIDLVTLNPQSGYYVIQGIADPENRLLETRDNDNISYALIYVDGRNVYTCERGYGESPWDPNRKLARSMPTNEPPVGSGICNIGLRKGHLNPGDDDTTGEGEEFTGLPDPLTADVVAALLGGDSAPTTTNSLTPTSTPVEAPTSSDVPTATLDAVFMTTAEPSTSPLSGLATTSTIDYLTSALLQPLVLSPLITTTAKL